MLFLKIVLRTPGQDVGIGRNASLLHATTRKITTNFKTNNTPNCQKIELHGSLTTKDFKKPHSFRRAGGVEMQSWGGEARRCSVVWRGGSSGGRMSSLTFTCDG